MQLYFNFFQNFLFVQMCFLWVKVHTGYWSLIWHLIILPWPATLKSLISRIKTFLLMMSEKIFFILLLLGKWMNVLLGTDFVTSQDIVIILTLWEENCQHFNIFSGHISWLEPKGPWRARESIAKRKIKQVYNPLIKFNIYSIFSRHIPRPKCPMPNTHR